MQNNDETLNKLNTFAFPEDKTASRELKTPNISPKTTTQINKNFSKRYSLSLLENKQDLNGFNDKNNNDSDCIHDYQAYDLPPLPRKKSIHSMRGLQQQQQQQFHHHQSLSISSNPLSIDSCLSYNDDNNTNYEDNQTQNYYNTQDDSTNFSKRFDGVYFDDLNNINDPKENHNSPSLIQNFSDENTKILKNHSSSSTDYSRDDNSNFNNNKIVNNIKRKSSVVYIISSPTNREVDLDVIQKNVNT